MRWLAVVSGTQLKHVLKQAMVMRMDARLQTESATLGAMCRSCLKVGERLRVQPRGAASITCRDVGLHSTNAVRFYRFALGVGNSIRMCLSVFSLIASHVYLCVASVACRYLCDVMCFMYCLRRFSRCAVLCVGIRTPRFPSPPPPTRHPTPPTPHPTRPSPCSGTTIH
jgi:hypothetical protein